jgi:hypothetical protein
MKKQIVLATIATLATGSAYATKARMNALGQAQDRGSFYINDTRNVFRNAARINQTNNYAVTEWGDTAATSTNAEGGFFKNQGSFSYGVYLGSDVTDQGMGGTAAGANNDAIASQNGYADYLAGNTRTTGSAANANTGETYGGTGFLNRGNDLDLFFGGDMGVEWGARLHYANAKSEPGTPGATEQKSSSLELGLGMVMGDLNAYVNYVLKDEAEFDGTNAGSKIENDGSMNLGVGYKWMDYTFFVDYDKTGLEYVASTGTAARTTEQSVLTVGAGYTKEISSTARLFTDVSFVRTSAEDSSATVNNNVEYDKSELPLTVGFEADATSWLTLRGSISQNIFINSFSYKAAGGTVENKGTLANSTDVQAGATLNFGKLMIDGMIGTNGNNGTAYNGDQGVLDTDRLLTRVAVHYWF